MERHDLPRTPRSIEELGIPVGVVHDLAMRRALYEGRTSTVWLSEGLGVSMAIMSKVVEELRDLRLIDLLGMEGRDYIFDLTEQGRDHARERPRLCRYAGHAPVASPTTTPWCCARPRRPRSPARRCGGRSPTSS